METLRGKLLAVDGPKDYDSLLVGAPMVVRFLTVSGKEFLPSKGVFRPIVPELIDRDAMLDRLRITREQLIDLAILVGTDFNEGVKGIPKKALKLVLEFGRIEQMPDEIQRAVEAVDAVRRIFLDPQITDQYEVTLGEPDFPAVVEFLCDEREFSRERVTAALERAFRRPTLW